MRKTTRIHSLNMMMLFLFVTTSCSKTEITPNQFTPRHITMSASITTKGKSRAFWTEDENAPSGNRLLFNWENDATGQLKSVVSGKNGLKSFVEGPIADTHISTTDNRLVSHLNVTSPLAPEHFYEQDDQLHAFYPVDMKHATLATTPDGLHYTFRLPSTVVQTTPNSTEHLRPYIFMKGTGNINVAEDTASTEIGLNIIPAIIQYRITNVDKQALIVKSINMGGELATQGDLHLSGTQEEIVYTEEQNTYSIESNLTLEPQQTINYYTLLLPTQFGSAEQLTFNLRGSYASGWTANYVDIPLDCRLLAQTGQLNSNYLYTIEIGVTRDEIIMTLGDISIQHEQKGEDSNIEISEKN